MKYIRSSTNIPSVQNPNGVNEIFCFILQSVSHPDTELYELLTCGTGKKQGQFLKCGQFSPPCKPQIGDSCLSQ